MKKSFQTEMDDTQQAVSQIVCLCTTIALHQEFGVGKTRLDRITDRIHDLEDQNTEVIMTPDANGRPSKAKAEAIRESWLAGYVTSDYRIPMLRAPRGRKEQQYQIAGNKAARIAWQIYAKAVIDILHYGPERLERLRKESHANYEQLNQWAHEDGLDVAMEKLRRCAADAMQAPDLEVTDILNMVTTSLLHVLAFPIGPAVNFLAGHGFRLASLDIVLLAEDLQLVDVVRALGDDFRRAANLTAGNLNAAQIQVAVKVPITLDVSLFGIGSLDGLNVLAERTEDFQSGWCFVEVGHIKEFDIGDSAAFNGKLLDGTGVFVKFHCHILQMPV